MKPKFAYVGIWVKDMEESIANHTMVFGISSRVGRRSSRRRRVASLASKKGGFSPELNYCGKGSPYSKVCGGRRPG